MHVVEKQAGSESTDDQLDDEEEEDEDEEAEDEEDDEDQPPSKKTKVELALISWRLLHGICSHNGRSVVHGISMQTHCCLQALMLYYMFDSVRHCCMWLHSGQLCTEHSRIQYQTPDTPSNTVDYSTKLRYTIKHTRIQYQTQDKTIYVQVDESSSAKGSSASKAAPSSSSKPKASKKRRKGNDEEDEVSCCMPCHITVVVFTRYLQSAGIIVDHNVAGLCACLATLCHQRHSGLAGLPCIAAMAVAWYCRADMLFARNRRFIL